MSAKPPALVVGTGFGCRIQVPALRAAGFEVVGLCGTNVERTTRRANTNGIAHSFTDLDAAISRTGAVVVAIATPPNTHAALAQVAIAHGCHVICEKPFAMDIGEARAMLNAAQRAGILHVVGHEFRWLPERALVARAIREGLIGTPRLLTLVQYISMLASQDAKMPRWWFDKQAGGGWLGASGSHIVDQVRCWLGEFQSVSAALPIVSEREGVAEDSFALRFQLANGTEGVMQHTAGAWGPSTALARVAGTRGSLWVEDGKVRLADRDGTRELAMPPELQLPPPPPPSDNPAARFSQFELGPYTRLCEAVRAAMDGGGTPAAVPLPTFADGLANMEVLEGIRASAARNGALQTIR